MQKALFPKIGGSDFSCEQTAKSQGSNFLTKFSRNVASIALGDVGSRLLAFVATAYLARVLQPENFGLVNLSLAVLGYLFLITSPGIPLYGTRLTAEREGAEVQLAGDILGLRVFLAVLCVFGTAVVLFFFSPGHTLTTLIALYSLSLFPMALTLDWFFQGKETMQGIGWSRVTTNLIYLIFLFFLVHRREDVIAVPIALLLGNLAGTGVLIFVFVKSYGSIRPTWAPSSLLRKEGRWFLMLKHSLPIGFGTVMSQISYNFPPIVLGLLSTVATVGYFAAANRIVFFLMLFDRLVTTLLLPAIARYHKSSPERLQPMLSFVLKIMLTIVFPVSVGGILLANRFITAVYGEAFIAAVPAFQWLMWYFFFSASGSVYVFGLIGIGQERIYSKMMFIGTIFQMGCIALGSFTGGAPGAAAGYALGEAAILFLMVFQFKKFFLVHFWSAMWRPLLAGIAMGLVLFPIRSYAIPVTISAGVCIFLITLFVVGGITKDDITSLRAKLL